MSLANHLDIHHQLEVLELIRHLPLTVVTSLHDLNMAAKICDHVLFLKGGRVFGVRDRAVNLVEGYKVELAEFTECLSLRGAKPRNRKAIMWDIRFPRAPYDDGGGSLAVVRARLQAVTRNPLVDPHLLGISSADAFGAIFALLPCTLLHTGLFLRLLEASYSATPGFYRCLDPTMIILAVSRLRDAISANRLVLDDIAARTVPHCLALSRTVMASEEIPPLELSLVLLAGCSSFGFPVTGNSKYLLKIDSFTFMLHYTKRMIGFC